MIQKGLLQLAAFSLVSAAFGSLRCAHKVLHWTCSNAGQVGGRARSLGWAHSGIAVLLTLLRLVQVIATYILNFA